MGVGGDGCRTNANYHTVLIIYSDYKTSILQCKPGIDIASYMLRFCH